MRSRDTHGWSRLATNGARSLGVILILAAIMGGLASGHRGNSLVVEPAPAVTPVTHDGARAIGAVTGANVQTGIPVAVRIANENALAVVPVGLHDDGEMEIPANPANVGWLATGGTRPGMNGTAVLAAHVDSRRYGLGPFVALHSLEVGSIVEITHDDGTTSSWRVSTRTQIPKDRLPSAGVFSKTGPPQLALITCGGRFDAATRSYDSNVVVLAVPATP